MDNVRMELFTAPAWCGPCRAIAPIIRELQAAGWDINVIDADDNRDLVVANQISGIPTFIIYNEGVQVDRFSGARPKGELLGALIRAAG